MNPFEEISENLESIEETQFKSTNIVIWKENRGRKTNTYISGWQLEENELKDYIKEFKKTNGCNGSLKTDNNNFILHFQGDKINDLIKFMIYKGVNKEYITMKGQ